MNKQKIIRFLYKWRVRTGLIVALAVLGLSRPTPFSLAGGFLLCGCGLLLRTWASGYLHKAHKLATSGPYKYTRNPLYLGNFIIGLSLALGSWSWWVLGIFLIYFGLFYPVVIQQEKEKMENLFPQEYKNYREKVPLFFPSPKPNSSNSGEKFSWVVHKKNKEFRALWGMLVFWVILFGKYMLL